MKIFAFPDDYSTLQAHVHWLWFITKCSELVDRGNGKWWKLSRNTTNLLDLLTY